MSESIFDFPSFEIRVGSNRSDLVVGNPDDVVGSGLVSTLEDDLVARVDVPDSDGFIVGTSRQMSSVRSPLDARNLRGVVRTPAVGKDALLVIFGDIPHENFALRTSGKMSSVGRVGKGGDDLRVLLDGVDLLEILTFTLDIVDVDDLVCTSDSDLLLVGREGDAFGLVTDFLLADLFGCLDA